MGASKLIAALLNPKNIRFVHYTATGYFFTLTLSVLYFCVFVAHPVVYNEDESYEAKSTVLLLFLLFNIMGNYFLAWKCNSFFNSGLILMAPPRSWTLCDICKQHAPPRSHHCSVCKACVLKQDHHCFFLCQCVGLRNQKFFIMFAIHVAIGSFYSMKVLLTYLSITYIPLKLTFFNIGSYLLPVMFYNWLWTSITVTRATWIGVLLVYCCFTTGYGCLFIFLGQCFLVYRGQTLNEFVKKQPSHSSLKNFSVVLGKFWFLQLFLPLPLRSKEEKSPWGYPVYYKSV